MKSVLLSVFDKLLFCPKRLALVLASSIVKDDEVDRVFAASLEMIKRPLKQINDEPSKLKGSISFVFMIKAG